MNGVVRQQKFAFIETDMSHSQDCHSYNFSLTTLYVILIVQSPTKAEQLIRTYSTGDSNHSSEEGSGTGKKGFFSNKSEIALVKSIIRCSDIKFNKHFRSAKRD